MINISDITFEYSYWDSNEKKKKKALDGVSLDIPSGQFVGILGSNGSGKSTLAKHLNVLLLPNQGTISINGKNTSDMNLLWEIRNYLGMVFQNPDNQIVGTSVEEDVAFGPENKNLNPSLIRKRVYESIKRVGLLGKEKSSPMRLSGGEKQRTAIAGVLADNIGCLVLDEPTAMLDPVSRKNIISLITNLNKEHGITVILITHHTEEVLGCDRVILMKNGHVVDSGTPCKIFKDKEQIKQVKMDIPPIIELVEGLRKRGYQIPKDTLTKEQLIESLVSIYEQKNSRD